MSRSNPIDIIPNPSTRWFEWSGSKGNLKYYDKEKKVNVEVDIPFDFILLDRLATIKGWHDASEAGIYSNEVRDTRNEPFIVKSFKMAEPIAEGFYGNIKDKVKANGGNFVLQCYIAFTGDDEKMALGSLQFHGAALGAWMDFENNEKENRKLVYEKGIQITESKSGKKGSIKYEMPVFKFLDLPKEVNAQATELDTQLQQYLKSYFKRTRVDQAAPTKDELDQTPPNENLDQRTTRDDEDEIPF
jgi:hypothetical protein